MENFLAIDIGASSGRHIVGRRGENGEITTDEVFRFANGVTDNGESLVWDVARLFENVKLGIRAAVQKYGTIESLAIDTWGVDYVLLGGDGEIAPCYSYRDGRTVSAVRAVHDAVPFETLYKRTGIQFQPFNTVYQLYDDLVKGRLDDATDFLMLPEYLAYLLTGVKKKEYTNATTTGLVNCSTGKFDAGIIRSLGLPARLFGELERPRTRVGALKPQIAAEVGASMDVVLCATHDTASAVEAIPVGKGVPYISSGTWSLLGIKTEKPINDPASRAANYSNEGGVGYNRYQKNIMGMWVVNRLRDELCPETPFGDIVKAARSSGFDCVVDIDDPIFLAPESMKRAFDYTVKKKPRSSADYFKCACNSLAHNYKKALEELRKNTGTDFSELHIVGGGAKNEYLNRLTESVCGVKVVALPIEASAVGNLKIQMGL